MIKVIWKVSKQTLKHYFYNYICHNMTPVDKKARKKKKRMHTFEKTTELI